MKENKKKVNTGCRKRYDKINGDFFLIKCNAQTNK